MESQLDELIGFLSNPRQDLRQVAASYIVGFTSPKSDHFGLLVSKASSVIPALISLFKEEELTVHDVVRSLVNLTTETSTLQYMQSEDTIRAVVQKITDPLCVVADLFCMLLSNMNKYEAIAVSLVQLEVPEVAQLASTSRALDQLTDVFVKGADKQYNKHAQFHFLASVFADLTMVPAGREYFLTKSKFDSKAHITKLIVFSEHKDLIRRGGVATAMKNVCFEKAYHSEILSEDGINMLPYILLPLCGPEEYDIDDMDGMPDEVQLLGDDKKRESDPTIRKTLVEALILLTTTLNGREFLRARKVYPILREAHKAETNDDIANAIDRVVQMLMRDESKETRQEGENDPAIRTLPKKPKQAESLFEEI